MKILNVRIKNINSLAGEHEIAFEKPPLNEVGIFAITGPNGAGKSTILDAICLALYGQTPRFKARSEQVMTRRASDCFAEVTFSLDERCYRSRWSARRVNGAVQTAMQLAGINGDETLLKETVNSVREEVGRLTGLDFKRFSRSVLLPQGEFAAFLHALSNERVEVIDKIVGKEAYQEHCEHILKAAESENERLIVQKETLAGMPVPESDAVLREELEAAESAYLSASAKRDALKEEQDWIRRRERDRQVYQDNQIALSSALARKEALRDEIDRLERAKAAAGFQADLETYEAQVSAAAEAEKRFSTLTASVEAYREQIATLSEKDRSNRQALDEAERRIAADADIFEAALAVDKEIEAAANAFREQVDRYEAIERKRKENLQAQAGIRDEIDRNASDLAATEKWLEKHAVVETLGEASPGIQDTVTRLKVVREKIQQQDAKRQASLQKLASAREFLEKARASHAKSLKKVEVLKARKAGQEETAAAILADQSPEDFEIGVQQNIRRLKNVKLLLRTAKRYQRQMSGNGASVEEMLRQKEAELEALDDTFASRQTAMVNFEKKIQFDEERSQLTAGSPCPLCGSLDHPYAADETDAKNARRTLKGMKKELRKMLKARNRLFSRIKGLKKRLSRMDSYGAQWTELLEESGYDWPTGDVDAAKQALRDLRQEVRQGKKALKVVKRREGRTRRMTQAVESAAERMRERQSMLEEQEGEMTLHRKLLSSIEQASAELTRQEEELAASLSSAVAPFEADVPRRGAEDAFILNLMARLDEYRARQNRRTALIEEGEQLADRARRLPDAVKALKTEAEALEGEIEERQKHLNQLKTDRQKRFGEDDPLRRKAALSDEIAALTAEKERILSEIQTSEAALTAAEAALAEARDAHGRAVTARDTTQRILKNKVIAASVFRNLDEVRESFISEEEKAIIETHVHQVETEIRSCRNTIEKIRISEEAVPSDRSAAEVELAMDDAEKALSRLKDDLDRLTEREAAAKRLKVEYTAARKELEALEKRCDALNALKLAIDSGDDAEVRRDFHEEMFKKLLEKAGGYVGMLNARRYRICQAEKDPFGIEVEVAAVGERNGERIRRPVEGLSGGETFVISLGMALALSDLTNGTRKIQSLFIDEGFGYLDDENLTQVINTLNEHLKVNGKRVGVISHVSRLDDEFQTKIQVIPEPDGTTRLEVLPKERPVDAPSAS